MLDSRERVIAALVRYTDWWQPLTGSILHVGPARRTTQITDGIPSGLLATLDERTELCRRMQAVDQGDRLLLFYWYLAQLPAHHIARKLGVSRRQVFRRRAAAIRRLIELGDTPDHEVRSNEPAENRRGSSHPRRP